MIINNDSVDVKFCNVNSYIHYYYSTLWFVAFKICMHPLNISILAHIAHYKSSAVH